MHSWQGKGVVSTMMMTAAKTTTKTRGFFDDDDTRTSQPPFLTRQPTYGRMHSRQEAGVIWW
jgi:hypothetical protein